MEPHAPPPDSARQTQGDGALPPLVQEILGKLARDEVECLICQEVVERSDPIWSCRRCFRMFHILCVREWVRKSGAPSASASTLSYCCPGGCKAEYLTRDDDLAYTCFCGRQRDPPNVDIRTPHSCGRLCARPLEDDTRCGHVCVLQCHPGPCPPCRAMVQCPSCLCGKQTMRRCTDRSSTLTCGRPCDRLLTCGIHRCKMVCHTGDFCPSCTVRISAMCFCGRTVKELRCGEAAEKMLKGFCCTELCGRKLACGNHACKQLCHQGACEDCELIPEKITTCHCGKTKLPEKRSSCLDLIPSCNKICQSKLSCGHVCEVKCHEGECPPCSVPIEQKCCCGSSTQKVRCCYKESVEVVCCDEPCGRMKNCGKHWCPNLCCPLATYGGYHLCQLPCSKKLQCGRHSCQQLCHSGHCPPCLECDMNAVGAFNDLARAATTLMTSSAHTRIADEKDGGLAAMSNPWIKTDFAEANMSFGDRAILRHAPAPGWRGANTPSAIMGTPNQWNALEPVPNAGNAGPIVTMVQPDVGMEDQEEACE